ncbi:MAG: prepilin-type N-terminal cleavage/methylation domain-containing protein [bacterium]|nr:prepilin-type N-terminal cleavage/methylation domain-containing protein [bacterium]
MNDTKGFTLIEMVVVLAVVAILAAILTPTITQNMNDAKIARATNEAQVIGAAMASFFKDTGRWPTKTDAASTADFYYVLNGDGNAMNAGSTSAVWSSDGGTWAAQKDTFHNHLARNTPGDASAEANQYAITGDLRWKGPYITEIKADPWGTHYSCNVISFWYNAAYRGYAIFVLSAGSNRQANTAYNQQVQGATTPAFSDDDIGFRIQ